jgi:hypothetical protein
MAEPFVLRQLRPYGYVLLRPMREIASTLSKPFSSPLLSSIHQADGKMDGKTNAEGR